MGKENDIENDIEKVCQFEDLEGKFLLVKVGNNDKPAQTKDIDIISDQLDQLFKDNNINCIAYVTHHAISMDIIK